MVCSVDTRYEETAVFLDVSHILLRLVWGGLIVRRVNGGVFDLIIRVQSLEVIRVDHELSRILVVEFLLAFEGSHLFKFKIL